jgi:hypothetical protein
MSPSPMTPAYTPSTAVSWATASVSGVFTVQMALDLLRRQITGLA